MDGWSLLSEWICFVEWIGILQIEIIIWDKDSKANAPYTYIAQNDNNNNKIGHDRHNRTNKALINFRMKDKWLN